MNQTPVPVTSQPSGWGTPDLRSTEASPPDSVLDSAWMAVTWVTLGLAAIVIAACGALGVATYRLIEQPNRDADALDGLGYVVAVGVAAPAILVALLLLFSFLARRVPTLRKAIIAVAAFVLGLELFLILIMFMGG